MRVGWLLARLSLDVGLSGLARRVALQIRARLCRRLRVRGLLLPRALSASLGRRVGVTLHAALSRSTCFGLNALPGRLPRLPLLALLARGLLLFVLLVRHCRAHCLCPATVRCHWRIRRLKTCP